MAESQNIAFGRYLRTLRERRKLSLQDVSSLGLPDDQAAAMHLLSAGVATVPGSSFYADPAQGRQQVRICFAKRTADLEEACHRLRRLNGPARSPSRH